MIVRHFLTVDDLSKQELQEILHEARRMKRDHRRSQGILSGKTVSLIFQKPSMRTRVACEVAVSQLGGAVIYLGQGDIQLGKREPIKDVARVISRYVDGVIVRMFAQQEVEEFARYSGVPVINGLSDLAHPCQAVADLMTIQEHVGRLRGVRLAYVGDGNNVLNSLMIGCALLGVHLSVATPRQYRPDKVVWSKAIRLAKSHGATPLWSASPQEATSGAEVIYTDVWVSMGQERERRVRLKAFRDYQVNEPLLSVAASHCRVMHCLPAHRGEEITEEVFESSRSIIFDQAENRLHVHKALLKFLLKKQYR